MDGRLENSDMEANEKGNLLAFLHLSCRLTCDVIAVGVNFKSIMRGPCGSTLLAFEPIFDHGMRSECHRQYTND